MYLWVQKVLAWSRRKQTKTADLRPGLQAEALTSTRSVGEQTQKLPFNLEREQALHQVTRTLVNVQNLPELLPDIIELVAEILPANRILLYLVDMEGTRTERFMIGGPGKDLSEETTYQVLEEGLTGWVLRERKVALSTKGGRDPRESEAVHQIRQQQQIGSVAVVPLS